MFFFYFCFFCFCFDARNGTSFVWIYLKVNITGMLEEVNWGWVGAWRDAAVDDRMVRWLIAHSRRRCAYCMCDANTNAEAVDRNATLTWWTSPSMLWLQFDFWYLLLNPEAKKNVVQFLNMCYWGEYLNRHICINHTKRSLVFFASRFSLIQNSSWRKAK